MGGTDARVSPKLLFVAEGLVGNIFHTTLVPERQCPPPFRSFPRRAWRDEGGLGMDKIRNSSPRNFAPREGGVGWKK